MGLIGGYLLSASFFLALAYSVTAYASVLVSATWGIFILWMLLFILPFFFEKVWKVWLLYLIVELLFLLIIYMAK